ncbi:MAG: enoyl-CoA hydratase/isomerase family protein [Chloroflexi bacterium]|nr:enoyl-CoA hydratase/isomerase family protein [Chloroflexota bacterium]
MKDYKTLTVEQEGQVATVTLLASPREAGANGHWELGSLFSDLREENSIRVIVLTGEGDQFKVPGPKRVYDSPERAANHADHKWAWHTFTGIIRCHQAMAEIEKPIVARVNGGAIGFGQSVLVSCDFIIAREDALIMDHHMGGTFTFDYGQGPELGGHDWANVPGDGGAALIPLLMSPYKAKEYLMLAQPYTAGELARMGIINYAVPASELDAKVQDIVRRLLQRGAYALARTKRLVNRRVVEHLNLVLDAAAAYEMVTFSQPLDIRELG